MSNSSSFLSAFTASLTATIQSEIGDKTFFVAAMLAMQNSPLVVFLGASTALLLMTILSAWMGRLLSFVLSPSVTHFLVVTLFFGFGAKLLYEAIENQETMENELQEIEQELKESTSPKADSANAAANAPFAVRLVNHLRSQLKSKTGQVFIQSFLLTFLGEWGDRSQIATVALATTKNPNGVAVGGFLGHLLCTTLAVIGGKMIATKVTKRQVNFVGALLFLGYGFYGLFAGPEN